jgi:hypothetical protein
LYPYKGLIYDRAQALLDRKVQRNLVKQTYIDRREEDDDDDFCVIENINICNEVLSSIYFDAIFDKIKQQAVNIEVPSTTTWGTKTTTTTTTISNTHKRKVSSTIVRTKDPLFFSRIFIANIYAIVRPSLFA